MPFRGQQKRPPRCKRERPNTKGLAYVDSIRLLGIVRRVERESARRGYGSDCTIDDAMIPDTGTLGQQLDMAAIGVDARLGPLSTRDRQLVNRLIRNCVLSSPRRTSPSQPQARRARRRVV